MKWFNLLVCGFGLVFTSTLVRGQGIRFQAPEMPLGKTLETDSGKLVFVDLYAEWCGPCKAMERSVFTVNEVADYFNDHFLNLRVVIDKPETEQMARSFGVSEFPTYLFLDQNGELVHKIIGFHSAGKLLAEARKACRKYENFTPMAQLNAAYQNGSRGNDFLYEYLCRKYELEGPQPEILNDFLAVVPTAELKTEKVLSLISDHVSGVESRGFEVLSASLDRFPLLTGNQQRAVLRGIGNSKQISFMKAVKQEDEKLLESLIDAVHQTAYSFEAAMAEERQFRYDYAKLTKNFKHFRVIANEEAGRLLGMSQEEMQKQNRKMKEDFVQTAASKGISESSGNYKMMLKSLENATEKAAAFQLNEFAEGFLLMNAGTEDLKSALKWSASAVKLYETPGHWKTYALLLNKLGRKSDAKKVLKKTIREARESDEDIQEYRDLLNSIK